MEFLISTVLIIPIIFGYFLFKIPHDKEMDKKKIGYSLDTNVVCEDRLYFKGGIEFYNCSDGNNYLNPLKYKIIDNDKVENLNEEEFVKSMLLSGKEFSSVSLNENFNAEDDGYLYIFVKKNEKPNNVEVYILENNKKRMIQNALVIENEKENNENNKFTTLLQVIKKGEEYKVEQSLNTNKSIYLYFVKA